MLKITVQRGNASTLSLKLEGKLLEPWLDELRKAIGGRQSALQGLELDLAALTFVDAAGARALLALLRQGATLTACSGYVAAVLKLQPDQGR